MINVGSIIEINNKYHTSTETVWKNDSLHVGSRGIVRIFENGNYGIEFFDFDGGHNLDGHLDVFGQRSGWYLPADMVSPSDSVSQQLPNEMKTYFENMLDSMIKGGNKNG